MNWCGNSNAFYHTNDGHCSASRTPDLSSQVNNIMACNAQGKLSNGSGCVAPASSMGTVVDNYGA